MIRILYVLGLWFVLPLHDEMRQGLELNSTVTTVGVGVYTYYSTTTISLLQLELELKQPFEYGRTRRLSHRKVNGNEIILFF